MSLDVRIGGSRRRVELRSEGGRYRGRAGDRAVDAEVIERGPSALLIRMGERTFDVTFDSTDGRYMLDLGTRQVAVEILDPLRSDADAQGEAEAAGRKEVRAAMPGKVVTVKVKVGEKVIRGQGLMVLEAMKMENEVPSPRAGTVVALGVSPGQAVERGALLAAVE